jgi:quercetin dioxygenase-like cupin family protein
MSTGHHRRARLDNARVSPGMLMHFLSTGDDTGGRFALIEARAVPGMEPPLHTHAHEDESFYLLEGQMEFTVGDLTIVARAGDHVFLPRGVRHGMTLLTPIHALITITPARFAQFFIDLTSPATSLEVPSPPDGPPPPEVMAQILEMQKAYGLTF